MKNLYESGISILGKTIEVIDFAMQLSSALVTESIKPEQLRNVFVDQGDAEFLVDRDWTKHKEVLKNDFANTAKIAIVSYQIIICKESLTNLYYHKENNPKGKLIFTSKEDDFNLYSAQKILKVTRNALGHMRAPTGELETFPQWYFKDKNDLDFFKIDTLGISLDTTKLQGEKFSWSHFGSGGLKNFKQVLSYLQKDFQKKMNNLNNKIV